MKNILTWFNDVSIRNKLILSNILSVFIPVLLVGIILTNGMRQLALKNATEEANTSVDRIKVRIEQTMKTLTELADSSYNDTALADLVSSDYKSYYEMQKAIRSYKDFDKIRSLYSEIKWIRLYSFNPKLLTNWVFMQPDNYVCSSEWYKTALKKDGAIIWRYIYDETQNAKYLSLIRVLKDRALQPYGVIVITLDKDYLYASIQKEPFETIVINDKGSVVLSTDKSFQGKDVSSIKLGQGLLSKTNVITTTKYKNNLSKVIIKSFTPDETTTQFKIISIFPIQAITGAANKTNNLGFVIIAISLMVSLLIILFFSNALSGRIHKLSNYVKRVFNEDFNVDIASNIKGNDEIGQLSTDIDTMVKNMRKLVYEVYEMDLQKKQLNINQKEIQLKMLASQINPHFLYNALETIRMRALCKGEKEIAEIVWQFGKLMRRNLEVSKEEVSLESEIDIVKSYLEIQKFRFGDRIDYTINVKNNIEGCAILPLLIQPIVENAFVHGLENKEENGEILVEVERINNLINITVKDNGLGIDEKRLETIIANLNNTESNSTRRIGINNIYQRIKLYYGDEYGLTISSKPNEETVVVISIPAIRRGEYA